jgi:hypothetical protein
MVDEPPERGDGLSERGDDDNAKAQDLSVAAKIARLGLVGLAVIAAGWTAKVYSWDPEANTREFELLKACFSVIVIAVVGELATFAFGILQRERDRRQDEAQRDRPLQRSSMMPVPAPRRKYGDGRQSGGGTPLPMPGPAC